MVNNKSLAEKVQNAVKPFCKDGITICITVSPAVSDAQASLSTPVALDINSKTGKPDRTVGNFLKVMRGDPYYSNVKYNRQFLRGERHVSGKDANGNTVTEIRPWTDTDSAMSREYIEATYGLYSPNRHADALRIFFREREYDPATLTTTNCCIDLTEEKRRQYCGYQRVHPQFR